MCNISAGMPSSSCPTTIQIGWVKSKLYVSIGWLEDNLLNGLFGEGGRKRDEARKQFQAHFDSSNSFATFSKWLLHP